MIADEFTRYCLELEQGVEVVNLEKRVYPLQVLLKGLDLVLVESAWLGYKNSWKRKVASYGDVTSSLDHMHWLTTLCRIKRIPTVFWNKEDPVCFERFKHQVSKFDVVLTTDSNMVPRYQKETDAKKVLQQSFFFQPELHNPEPTDVSHQFDGKTLFCGGYYEQEYPDRAERLDWAIEGIGKKSVVIFDRFDGAKSGWQKHKGLKIEPSFDYERSKPFYQAGAAHLNVNSIDGLGTMFSRRMLELIACNQKVIDITNYKKKSALSEFVIQVSNAQEAKDALNKDKPNVDYQYLIEKYSVSAFMKKLKSNI
ncbi:hypothetical protein HF888_03410 [Bermanella marisrubri]|uniref:hypothetical protein n=1 Tax=Bermanella marisrubri TaxID=207949 RepID=UPI001059B807|nr:hypothetical protein [Bermanella marisrubri]QIZ83333.1 hypothetical protein HF888_03410 [Bermanella marisrubri]